MEDSVFTKIIKGEIPASKIYEDENNIAIIPLHPIAIAHVLVIPKKQVDEFIDLPQEDYDSLMAAVKKVAKHMRNVVPAKRIGLQISGLDVPHVHVHVVAFDTPEQYREHPDSSLEPDWDKIKKLADKLAF